MFEERDNIWLGDANLDMMKWLDPHYHYINMSREVQEFLLEESCHQLVNDYTRVRLVDGVMERSGIDHITVNCPDRVSPPQVIAVGRSDHMGVMITKYCKDIKTDPRTTKKRVYKSFVD